jgi:hypothetical protein
MRQNVRRSGVVVSLAVARAAVGGAAATHGPMTIPHVDYGNTVKASHQRRASLEPDRRRKRSGARRHREQDSGQAVPGFEEV